MRALPWARIGIGLLQGLALLALYQAAERKAWPATNGLVFAPLVATSVFVPVLVLSGVGNLRLRTVIVWALVALFLCAGFAIYDMYRDPILPGSGFFQLALAQGTPSARTAPSSIMWISLAALLWMNRPGSDVRRLFELTHVDAGLTKF